MAKKEKKELVKTGDKARTSDGRFKLGSAHQRKGRGRPQWSTDLMRTFKKCLTPKKMEEIVKATIKSACEGNFHAQAYLMDRGLGKIKQEVAIESDTPIVFSLVLGDKQLEHIEYTEPKQIEEDTNIIDVIPTIIKEQDKCEGKK